MKVLHEKPPEWIMSGCMNQFRLNVERTLWTYGDVIYNPGGWAIPDAIIAHESLHSVQQKNHEGGKDGWWKQFLSDPDFRIEQEAQAYGVQYAHFCGNVKDRNKRAMYLHEISGFLSGPLYQSAISRSDATKGIREIAKAVS